jgi:hypothetical protein
MDQIPLVHDTERLSCHFWVSTPGDLLAWKVYPLTNPGLGQCMVVTVRFAIHRGCTSECRFAYYTLSYIGSYSAAVASPVDVSLCLREE